VTKKHPTGGTSTPSSSRRNTPRERPHAHEGSDGNPEVNQLHTHGRLPHSRTLSAASSNSNSSPTLGYYSATGEAASSSSLPPPAVYTAVHARNLHSPSPSHANHDSSSFASKNGRDTTLASKSNRSSQTGQLSTQTAGGDSLKAMNEAPMNVKFVSPIFPGIAVTSEYIHMLISGLTFLICFNL
jgi:hypothetical protein